MIIYAAILDAIYFNEVHRFKEIEMSIIEYCTDIWPMEVRRIRMLLIALSVLFLEVTQGNYGEKLLTFLRNSCNTLKFELGNHLVGIVFPFIYEQISWFNFFIHSDGIRALVKNLFLSGLMYVECNSIGNEYAIETLLLCDNYYNTAKCDSWSLLLQELNFTLANLYDKLGVSFESQTLEYFLNVFALEKGESGDYSNRSFSKVVKILLSSKKGAKLGNELAEIDIRSRFKLFDFNNFDFLTYEEIINDECIHDCKEENLTSSFIREGFSISNYFNLKEDGENNYYEMSKDEEHREQAKLNHFFDTTSNLKNLITLAKVEVPGFKDFYYFDCLASKSQNLKITALFRTIRKIYVGETLVLRLELKNNLFVIEENNYLG